MFHRFLRAATHVRGVLPARALFVGGAGCAVAAASYCLSSTVAAAAAASEVDEEATSNYAVNMDVSRLVPDRPPNLALRGVLFVTRHGSRTPISLLPGQTREDFQQQWGNCPLGDHSTIPCGRGLLTTFGEFQLNSVGWHLRQRYVHADGFLPAGFDPTLVRFRSTDLPRTQLSLARMVQGMYPGLPLEVIAPLVEVRKQKDENMYPNHYFCPRLKELYIEACHASYQADPSTYPAAARYRELADSPDAVALRERFASALGAPASGLGTWVVIGDELKCRQAVGMPHVPGVTQAMSDQANILAEQTFWHILRGGATEDHSLRRPACPNSSDLLYTDKTPLEQEVVRLGMGRLMEEMFGAMDNIRAEHDATTTTPAAAAAAVTNSAAPSPSILNPPAAASPAPRFLVYSGHDTTIAPLLATFHATHSLVRPSSPSTGWPVLGGNMIVELLEVRQPGEDEESAASRAKEAAAHRSLEQSLAPLPPSATDDDEHHLPKQSAELTKREQQQTKKPEEFSPHGSPAAAGNKALTSSAPSTARRVNTRAPFKHGPSSRWFVRLLLDHKEVSIIPYEEYRYVREQYRVKDWAAECKQKTEGDLPPHAW